MEGTITIEQLTSIVAYVDDLSDLLVRVVNNGASIGFLGSMQLSESKNYWKTVLSPEVILLVAKKDDKVVGSVQVHLCTKPNGNHRAEIAKLMTHPKYRRHGIGRSLMQEAERRATLEGRSLLVLDTREGDPSNYLYTSIGYKQVGRIPHFARSTNGDLDATVFYYKMLDATIQ